MAKLTKRFCFNLTDTLTGNVEFLTNFFQRTCTSIIQAETKSQHLLLTFGQGSENLLHLLLEECERSCFCRPQAHR